MTEVPPAQTRVWHYCGDMPKTLAALITTLDNLEAMLPMLLTRYPDTFTQILCAEGDEIRKQTIRADDLPYVNNRLEGMMLSSTDELPGKDPCDSMQVR